jgi:hypothetical protein
MTLSTKPMAQIMTLKQNIQGGPVVELWGPGIIYSSCCGYPAITEERTKNHLVYTR